MGAANCFDIGAVESQAAGGGCKTIRAAQVSPSALAFGNWAVGTTSNPMLVTVTNVGTVALAGGTFSTPGAPFTRVTTGGFPAGAPNCGANLAVGASCTLKYRFAPTSAVTSNANVTVTYTGAAVTGSPVALSGTGVANRAAVSISAPTITLPTGQFAGTGVVTLTNIAVAGGSSVAVNNVSVSGGSFLTYFFLTGGFVGPDNCTGTNLAPGASCTVTVGFVNVFSARGVNRTGTVTYYDSGAGSPQSAVLTGFATR